METSVSIEKIDSIKTHGLKDLALAKSEKELAGWRIKFLGRKGLLTIALRSLVSLEPSARQKVGSFANKTKETLLNEFQGRKSQLSSIESSGVLSSHFDVTLPGRKLSLGKLHPTTQIIREICSIFEGMGFSVVEGPEVEWDEYNFQKLNIPKNHPARDMWNTFWVDEENSSGNQMLLRTHTSPMQARIMETNTPPVRVIVPGKCYRYEATDATHESQFYQIEGLAVDKNMTFANLKGTLYQFARQLFGENRRVRFRCDYFPFVEPGVDMSIDCFACQGEALNCRICSSTGWVEIMGAGMVHPAVLESAGYDPSVYTGFAFGLGPERIGMLKYGIEDIRMFYANDCRFLEMF
jgi:phenylalanyl-tRNA synthetase alpha chain